MCTRCFCMSRQPPSPLGLGSSLRPRYQHRIRKRPGVETGTQLVILVANTSCVPVSIPVSIPSCVPVSIPRIVLPHGDHGITPFHPERRRRTLRARGLHRLPSNSASILLPTGSCQAEKIAEYVLFVFRRLRHMNTRRGSITQGKTIDRVLTRTSVDDPIHTMASVPRWWPSHYMGNWIGRLIVIRISAQFLEEPLVQLQTAFAR
jgi:hypothetical protein